jgi:simple sugar transport system permease protein
MTHATGAGSGSAGAGAGAGSAGAGSGGPSSSPLPAPADNRAPEGEPPAQGPPAKEPSAQSRRGPPSAAAVWRERILGLREGSIIVVTLVVAIYFAVNTSSFATSANFKTLLPYFAPFAIFGAGEVFVMILGEIDLSIGGTFLLAPYLFYKIATAGLPLVPSVLIALLACMAVGLINGFFVAVVGISSFVTTLGTLFTLEGLTLIISHGTPVATPGAQVHATTHNVTHVVNGVHVQLPETINHISTFAKVFGGGVYSELIWALLIVIVLQTVLTFTRWGLYTVAVGSNKLGAAEAGVRVRLVMVRNFILCATTGGLVGILEAVRSATVQPDTAGANEYLFLGIAAAVIGGTLLAGGSGTVVGALIGALFLGVLHDGLTLQGVNADYLLFYTGLAIIVAMTVNVYVQRARRGQGSG